jgi:hypothetical protein
VRRQFRHRLPAINKIEPPSSLVHPRLSRQQEEAGDDNFTTFMFASATALSKTATPFLPSLAELGSRRAAAQETLRAKEAQDNLKFYFKPYNKLITDRIIMKKDQKC